MSASQYDEFDRRMRRISRRHSQLSRGYVTSVNDDGLVVAKPRRRMSKRTVRTLIFLAFALLAFKSFLHANLGDAAYNERLAGLSEGSQFEQVGAWLMTADPVTRALSAQIVAYL